MPRDAHPFPTPEAREKAWGDRPLPEIHRFITTHDADGKAVFAKDLPETANFDFRPEVPFFLGYTTNEFPPDLNADKDLAVYKDQLPKPQGLVLPGGTVLRVVDMPPNGHSPMHRTVSLDYGIVLEGTVELELDGGETRVLKRGDIAIQRGTVHSWRNLSSTEWTRMVYVLQECKPVVVKGKALAEELDGMEGVVDSGV